MGIKGFALYHRHRPRGDCWPDRAGQDFAFSSFPSSSGVSHSRPPPRREPVHGDSLQPGTILPIEPGFDHKTNQQPSRNENPPSEGGCPGAPDTKKQGDGPTRTSQARTGSTIPPARDPSFMTARGDPPPADLTPSGQRGSRLRRCTSCPLAALRSWRLPSLLFRYGTSDDHDRLGTRRSSSARKCSSRRAAHHAPRTEGWRKAIPQTDPTARRSAPPRSHLRCSCSGPMARRNSHLTVLELRS